VPFTVALVGACIYGASVVVGATVVGTAIDDLVLPVFVEHEEASPAGIRRVMGLLMGFAILRIVSVTVRRYYAGMAASQMKAALRVALTERYLRVPLRFHRDRPSGELLSRVDNDAQMAAEILSPLPLTLGILMMVVVATVRPATLDVYMLLIALALFPVLAVANHFYTKLVEEPAAAVQREVADVASTAHESFDGVMVVKTLGREEAEVERLGVDAARLRESRLRVGFLRAGYEPALELVPVAGTVVVLAVGVWRVGAGGLSPGEVIEVMTLFTLMAFPLQIVGHLFQEMPYSVVAMDRVTEFLHEPEDPQPDPGEDLPAGALGLRLRDLSFAYEKFAVLDRLDVEVAPGEVVAIVGSTGGGKSTLFDLVARLARPTGGAISLAGIPLEEVASEALREHVALVFQETFLFADSVRDNIDLGRPIGDEVYEWALKVSCVDEFIDVLPDGDATVVGERGVTLSGGQRQRIALARALVRRPGLLLLDDATSAIDPAIEAEILGHLENDLDATTLIVAHRLSTIRLAGRVLFLADGRLRGDGTHVELLQDPHYEALLRVYEKATGTAAGVRDE